MDFNIPNDTIGEITIIGTGGGYGESCVIHLGVQKWLVVDSCVDPISKKSLPLQYLENIGVNTDKDVVIIVCTHWDDDHILGISQLLEKCSNSKFSFAESNDRVKFLRMVSLDYQKISKEVTNSSTIEFNQSIDILEHRHSIPLFSYPDRPLVTVNIENFYSQAISLSPSDSAIQQFDRYVSTLITEYGNSNRRIVPLTPNFNSVSLFLKLGPHRAILGGDLEVSSNNKTIGWDDVVDNSQSIDKRATFFKIPHHGSKNAFHDRLWTLKLSDKTKSCLTPWNLGSKLPSTEMKDIYKKKSDELYITSDISKGKPKHRDKSINKMIQELKIDLEEVPYKHGIIRARINMNDINAEWSIECSGSAIRL
jgi:hypothetical protein